MLTDALVTEVVAAVASAWERKWEQTAGTEVVANVDAGSAAVHEGAGGARERKWERATGTEVVDGKEQDTGHAQMTTTIDATGPHAVV